MKQKPKRRIHLIANAHIDPVWLWEWEEGVAATLATFRSAADICEETGGFVFNHNEALLYEWVEEHEPALFQRIQGLVAAGKWHIMGGWFLQPDCNMPSGESFIRQILTGREYFKRKFGARPTTAINFDPFGHTRGLVQIMAKAGYDAYLFCRPGPDDKWFSLEADNFTWIGYDGSRLMARREPLSYNSALGQARRKVKRCLTRSQRAEVTMALWGVGNHGGGPSRKDLRDLATLAKEERRRGTELVHSTPERFFAELRQRGTPLPERASDLNPWAVGCYTSQIRIKQRHRQLENELFLTEKMAVTAAINGLLPWPAEELRSAQRDLLVAEFHDILPGSAIQAVEDAALRGMAHGLEILSRIKTRTFLRLASGQPKAPADTYPILVYNPHPFPVTATVECEIQLADQNWTNSWSKPQVFSGRKALPAQSEKEASNLNLDWRKRVVFSARLEPGRMNRFDCRFVRCRPRRPAGRARLDGLYFLTHDLEVRVNPSTGLVDRLKAHGHDYVRPGAFAPTVFGDSDDAWEMRATRFGDVMGRFQLASVREKRGVTPAAILPSVRIIEDGPVRTVIEAILCYQHSRIVMNYLLPKQGTEVGVTLRLLWGEQSRMLKLVVPLSAGFREYRGQVAYGTESLPVDGTESVSHRWSGAVDAGRGLAFTAINDGIYGSHFRDGLLGLSLVRSPAYTGHPIGKRPLIAADRHIPRIDQGERLYNFWFQPGKAGSLDTIDRQALVKNERPVVLSLFPSGDGRRPLPSPLLSDAVVQLSACKYAEDGKAVIVRLFEPTGVARRTTLRIPILGVRAKIQMSPFEIKTLRVDLASKRVTQVNVIEEA